MGRKSTKNRKPKIVEARSPSGRPTRAQEGLGPEYAPTEIIRMRNAAMRGLKDAEWGSELGCLYLERKITTAQYGAGKWWREMASQYLSAIDAPWPTPRGISMERGLGRGGHDPDTEEGQRQSARERNTVENFRSAHAALMSTGMMAEHHVRELCESNIRPIGFAPLRSVVLGLHKLAEWRDEQLTNKGKSASGR